jgi:hypothetical protein
MLSRLPACTRTALPFSYTKTGATQTGFLFLQYDP